MAAKVANPSFLAIHPTQRFLYAVGEMEQFGGKKGGAVSALSLDPKTGKLALLNQGSSGGGGPCHLVVDSAGKHVLVANYGGGSVEVLAIGEDGKVGEKTAFEQHRGSSADKSRQEAPHAHSVNLDRANRFAFVADLGLDKIVVYRYDADRGTLTAAEPASVAAGSGPRHFAFHPDGKHAYVINEMANTLTVFHYDPENGVLKTLQTVPTLPEGFKGKSWGAEVQVHPSGKFVYGSNRGDRGDNSSIAVFTVNPKSGELTPAGHQADNIKTPRNFGIDPTGNFLVVANQDGDSLVVFRINPTTGALEPTGQTVQVSKPVCVKFVPRAD